MGLPGFFAWLLKNFKNKILLKRLNERPDHFYIDSNCLFHPECNRIKEYYTGKKTNNLEKYMFERIKNYLTYLYTFVDAKKINGTMVDGVCPLAKMSQQRKRRYKAIDESIVKNNLKRKHNKIVDTSWNNTVITPGTEFMERLHQELLKYFKNMKSNTTHIYSSYHTPSEGEHTILQHIKQNVSKDDVVVIYGLDADLIFLAMTSGIENIYLLRESLHFGIKTDDDELYDPLTDVAQELMYVSVKSIKEAFNEQMRLLINSKSKNLHIPNLNIPDDLDFSNDLVVICFLLGNDFLPHFPSIHIHKGGLDSILDGYIDTLIDINMSELLTSMNKGNITINSTFFTIFLEKMGNKEHIYFKETLPKFNSMSNRKKCYAHDDYSRELWNIDNLKSFKINDPIKLGFGSEDDWKFRYYEYYFGGGRSCTSAGYGYSLGRATGTVSGRRQIIHQNCVKRWEMHGFGWGGG